jgi:hypothetical protein
MAGPAFFFLVVTWGYFTRLCLSKAEQFVEKDRGQDLRDHLVNRLTGGALLEYLDAPPVECAVLAMSSSPEARG